MFTYNGMSIHQSSDEEASITERLAVKRCDGHPRWARKAKLGSASDHQRFGFLEVVHTRGQSIFEGPNLKAV